MSETAGVVRPVASVNEQGVADVVPFVRGTPGVECPPEVKARAFVLWGTFAGGDAAATERLLQAEAENGEVVPTARTIRRWAHDDNWAAQAAAAWQNVATRDKALYDLQMAMINNAALGEVQKRDVQTGAYDDQPMVGALRLKAAELSGRTVERVIAALRMPVPPDVAGEDDDEGLTRAEREARAGERMAQRKQGRP
jgi:hypothetical protein